MPSQSPGRRDFFKELRVNLLIVRKNVFFSDFVFRRCQWTRWGVWTAMNWLPAIYSELSKTMVKNEKATKTFRELC